MSCSLEDISSFTVVRKHYVLILWLKSQNIIKSFQVVSVNPTLELEFHIRSVTHDQRGSILIYSFTPSFFLLINSYSLGSRYIAGNKINRNSCLHGVHVLPGGDRQSTNTYIMSDGKRGNDKEGKMGRGFGGWSMQFLKYGIGSPH